MNWTKLAILLMMLTVALVVGQMGVHMGFNVNGVPQTKSFSKISPIPGSDKYIVYFDDGTTATMTMAEIHKLAKSTPSAIDYLWHLASFSIDGIPSWLSIIFIVFLIAMLYIVFSIFLPGGGG